MKKIITHKKCEECDEGEMRFNSNAPVYSNFQGTSYPHMCNLCGHKRTFLNESYPHEYLEFSKKEIKDVWE